MTESYRPLVLEPQAPEEVLKPYPATWVGGLFEAGGGMGFNIRRPKGKVYATPYIQYTDDSIDRINYLKQIMGGSVRPNSRNSYWTISAYSTTATDIAIKSKPYLLSRKDMIAAFELWLDASAEEKAIIAQQVKAFDRADDLGNSSYDELLENSEFLAGVLDARATVIYYDQKQSHKRYPLLALSSRNHFLVNGLKNIFGGSLIDPSGTVNPSETSSTSYLVWRVTDPIIIEKVIDQTNGNLRFKDKFKFE